MSRLRFVCKKFIEAIILKSILQLNKKNNISEKSNKNYRKIR